MTRTTSHRRVLFACTVAILGATARAEGPDASGRAQAAWWIHHHGVVTPAEDPLVERAAGVFERVAAASDKRGNRLPRLLVLRGRADPFAAAIQDGSILLSRTGLQRCYEGVDRSRGDAHLAFVLGHELAHLAKDDFWHVAAFTAVETHLIDPAARTALLDLLRTASDAGRPPAGESGAAKLKELEADSYGLVYMMIAGFDPGTVLAPGGTFLDAWVSQLTSRAAYADATHPEPSERAAFLRTQLRTVAEDLEFFHFGVRLLQLGRHEDAILFLERFAERFPSREVYADLGLSHYLLAMRGLWRCDPAQAVRFRLSVQLDVETLAERAGSPARAVWPAACLTSPAVTHHLRPAISYLEHAAASDPGYVPARLNLAAAHLLAGEPAKALGVLDEVEALESEHAGARNDRAVALYLFGLLNTIDTMDQATRILSALVEEHPDDADALYNLAAMENERGRNAAARERWAAFLALEPAGPWADVVRARLDAQTPLPSGKRAPVAPPAAPPIPLGVAQDAVLAGLADVRRRPFRLGVFHGEFLEAGTIRALVIEDYVEIVEAALPRPIERDEIVRRLGTPERGLAQPHGETLVYAGFALELREGRAERIIHFESGAR